MTSGVRFGAAQARMHALKSRLWTPDDRQLVVRGGVAPDGRPISGAPADVFGGIVRWYVRLAAIYASGVPLLRALFRRHEAENVKLLWRAAMRGRPPAASCWRPLEPLASVSWTARVLTPHELVQHLDASPYGAIGRALLRSHAADLPAAEIGLDRWVWNAILDEIQRLPASERDAGALVRLLAVEHDVGVLRRGPSLGFEPDLVAKSTVVLSRECRLDRLTSAAAWRPDRGSLSRVLPRALTRIVADAATWDDVEHELRRARLRACRRAFVGWPFRLAPAIAALLLCEEQAHAAMSVAAARARGGAAVAHLPLALAASGLEA